MVQHRFIVLMIFSETDSVSCCLLSSGFLRHFLQKPLSASSHAALNGELHFKASCCIEHDDSQGDIFEGLLPRQLLTTATGLIEVDHLSCGHGKKTSLRLPCTWHLGIIETC